MKNSIILIIGTLLTAGCSNKTGDADAFGNFEATEVIVSAESSGRIISLNPVEGTLIEKGEIIGITDTTILTMQKAEIDAAINGVRSRLGSINAQNDILSQQIENLKINIARISKMMKDDAATQKQFDDLTGQEAVLQKQIAANNTQKTTVASEISVYESKKATLGEQIRRCSIKSPLNGTVIEKFAEAGEITAPGKPIVKIADLSVIRLKAYISGTQLGRVKIGQECTVRIDDGKRSYRSFKGTVSYVSEKAEFTPKIIQTKEERVLLVYAVNIDVINDGSLKSGMPGELLFTVSAN